MFKDFDINFQCELHVGGDGYLDPQFYDVSIRFGESKFHHDNWIVSFVMHQVIYYSIIVLENSVYFVGKWIFSSMLGPSLDRYLNHYKMPLYLPSPFKGQTSTADFHLDFRNTNDPYIGEGFIDFYFLGELLYGNSGCILDPDHLTFQDFETNYSQLVISESAATCLMQNFAESPIGHLELNTNKINQLFERTDIRLDSTGLNKLMPVFEDKLGANQPLIFKLGMTKPKVYFKKAEADIALEYTIKFEAYHIPAHTEGRLDMSNPLLIEDELKAITTMNVVT